MTSLVAYDSSDSSEDESSHDSAPKVYNYTSNYNGAVFPISSPSARCASTSPRPKNVIDHGVKERKQTLDAPSDERTSTQTSLQCKDYLGLHTCSDEDSDSVSEDCDGASSKSATTENDTSQQSTASQLAEGVLSNAATTDSNISSLDAVNRDSCFTPCNETNTTDSLVNVPSSEFWSGQTQVSYRWKSNVTYSMNDLSGANKASSYHQLNPTSQSMRNPKKKMKLSETGCSMTATNKLSYKSKPLMKTCFYVHHYVKPVLHQTLPNQLPRKKSKDFLSHSGAVNRVKWCTPQYSHLLMSISMDRTVKVWNAFSDQQMQPLQEFHCHDKAVKGAAWCSGGKQIITASYDKTSKLLDVETGNK